MNIPNKPVERALQEPKTNPQAVVAAFQALAEIEAVQLPEPHFRDKLLPLIMQAQQTPIDLTLWVAVAGTAQKPLDVIDGAGNVLFRVPALLGQIDSMHDSHRHIVAVVNQSLLVEQNQHAAVADKVLYEGLSRLEVSAVGRVASSQEQWKKIFQHYGLLPAGPTVTDTSPRHQEESDEGDDEPLTMID